MHLEYANAYKLKAGFAYFEDGTASRSAWGDLETEISIEISTVSIEISTEIKRKIATILLLAGSRLSIVGLLLA